MNFLTFLFVCKVISMAVYEKIIVYNMDRIYLGDQFRKIKENPEMWNVEIHSIDIYSLFISKAPVPFIVKPLNSSILEFNIYVEDFDKYLSGDNIFYIETYPIKNPSQIFRTGIYKLEVLDLEKLSLHNIEYHVVVFLCHMVYLYRSIVHINIENFPVSKYKHILDQYTYTAYDIPKRFVDEIPLKKHHGNTCFVHFIKDCLRFSSNCKLLPDNKKIYRELIKKYASKGGIIAKNLCNKDFKRFIHILNNKFALFIDEYEPIQQKLLEIYGSKLKEAYENNRNCCIL
ncbi:hypothetical protein NGRA_1672 [Nosema granulosis]|uniref:Uncharacterized protein n=1 Tax=Nosema granulosis TaxID=83296 RepID=A0A9P6GZL3_9MICR|nr:hypothetical protein NGRA_1672 [Nosema granulosis]